MGWPSSSRLLIEAGLADHTADETKVEDSLKRGEVVWTPTKTETSASNIGSYLDFLRAKRGLKFRGYEELHSWSIQDLGAFWQSVWEFFEVKSYTSSSEAVRDQQMPGAQWFPDASLNYAEHALRRTDDGVAVIERSQSGDRRTLSWAQLRADVASVRAALRRSGVSAGDVVATYTPLVVEALVVYLAAASLGAVYTSCASELGVDAVVGRLAQVRPRVLFASDGYRYANTVIDRRVELAEITARLEGLETVVLIPTIFEEIHGLGGLVTWEAFLNGAEGPLQFEPVPFDHPLVVAYSSGTTGAPKGIIHSHGGVLLEHLKSLGLQLDVRRSDRFFWYTTASWMMWNYLVSGLLLGASIVLYDGDPMYPSPLALWEMAVEEEVSVFGVSPRFLQMTRRLTGKSAASIDLHRLRIAGSTGSPLGEVEYEWFYSDLQLDVPLVSASGGTDILSGLVCWCPMVPIYAGEISCAALGVDVGVIDEAGRPLIDQQGELVVRQPMPSMPVGFWGDADGSRLRATYFEANPGVWTQGDWAMQTSYGSFILTGRSDATLNRNGVRIGTAEIYGVVESIPAVIDSVAVYLDATEDRKDMLLLFVVLDPAAGNVEGVAEELRSTIRRRLSPRHVPNQILAIPKVPRNAAGKKLEVAVKAALQGELPDGPASTGLTQEVSEHLAKVRARLQRSTG